MNTRQSRERAVNQGALRLAREFVSAPDDRAQVKVMLASKGMPLVADMIDEAVIMARELIRLAASRKKGKS